MTSLAGALSMPLPATASSSSSATPTEEPVTSSDTPRNPPPVFEFTKRKRWADLLVTELSEAIIFVLSPTAKVWYCGAAVADLLGWRDDDVVDREFSEYVNQDDIGPFHAAFQRCIHNRSELLTYIRLRCKPASTAHNVSQDFQASASSSVKEVLFEIKGYPHFVPDTGVITECKCFFMMAKPYPSRNTAMLNTFLELKMENQRLEEHLMHLRSLADNPSSSATSVSTPTTTNTTSTFPPASYLTPYTNPGPGPQRPFGSTPPNQQYMNLPEPTSFYSGSFEELLPSPSSVRFENMFTLPQPPPPGVSASVTSSGNGEEDAESAKKKQKKTYGFEQYVCVTCGRTDSPEWRKGPNGPKTLCNACGLRWAKTVKTRRESAASVGAAGGGDAS
ncbi:hypothetical protein EUX98_g6405 [Antrodiella citrinella]|uniref:GATA-type domain-containing protein n=1 Tax=Antrodiella citrinella TaxID=2447956 RepID=A0A4S4MP72_9APHY|nr:hypothetical protein EUX98_g6405 [Antrodiella citrinella]